MKLLKGIRRLGVLYQSRILAVGRRLHPPGSELLPREQKTAAYTGPQLLPQPFLFPETSLYKKKLRELAQLAF